MQVAIDTETTGPDLFHGCRPFAVSMCDEQGKLSYWEWEVNPTNREAYCPYTKEINRLINQHTTYIFHNAKFDIRGLGLLGIKWSDNMWDRTEDTVIASHCFRNQWAHGLKSLCDVLFHIPADDEEALNKAVTKARAIAKTKGWRYGKAGDPHFPAIKGGKMWKCDMWLPAVVAKEDDTYSHWANLLSTYAVRDAERTMILWKFLRDALKEEGLYKQYQQRRRLLQVTYSMENTGAGIFPQKIATAIRKYQRRATKAQARCSLLAPGIENLRSPVQLRTALFVTLGLLPIKMRKTGPSTDEDTINTLLRESGNGKAKAFLTELLIYRRSMKAADYVGSYFKHSVKGKIHSSVNITGTRFTRQSTNAPNLQNVPTGKEEGEEIAYNLREIFGPPPGRQWWDIDYSNLELRIWAYSCGNQEMMDAFDTGKNIHLIIARELHPKLEQMSDDDAKNTKDYKRTKNGDFALIYGASPAKADLTYGVEGAYDKISQRFPEVRQFTMDLHQLVREDGYIHTRGGYRLYIPRDEPHKAVSGFVQGTAGEIMTGAMIDCHDYINNIPSISMILQIHDELVFETSPEGREPGFKNLIQIMERQGERVGVPTPVSGEIITEDWSKGKPVS